MFKILVKWVEDWIHLRPHFEVKGEDGKVYLLRWWILPRNPVFNIFLHKFLADDARILHDHPWWYISIILKGGYWEITDGYRVFLWNESRWLPTQNRKWHPAGSLLFRKADHAHRLEFPIPCRSWSLVLTGPRVREWGFLCRSGWIPWHEFVKPNAPGEVGRGCGD